ncbi:MAG: hypothetical protein WBG48_15680 [Pricia sp.]
MESKKYLDDISEIKNMMSRSSRFISLSGLSGILAGIYALIAAAIARMLMRPYLDSYPATGNYDLETSELIPKLVLLALATITLAIITGIALTVRKAQKNGEKVWDVGSKRLVYNFMIPLSAGGAFSLVLMQYGIVGLVAPATLIFYGLACVNAAKYTYGDVRYLGLTNIIIGLVATQFIGYGLYFWALGFGLLHIVYGTLMYFKYDRTNK